MTTPTTTTASTPSVITSASAVPFEPFDFLQRFVGDISGGVVFRTANGSPIPSTIRDGDLITPAQVNEAFENIAGYFKPPGLSSAMDVNRVQQYAGFLAGIAKHQHRCHGVPARITTYELGNAIAALQQVVKPQTPKGKN